MMDRGKGGGSGSDRTSVHVPELEPIQRGIENTITLHLNLFDYSFD